MLWIQLVHRTNWNSVICGHVESAARNVSGMLQKTIDSMPVWTSSVKVKTSPYQGSQKTRSINATNSRYSIGSAQRPEGLRSEDISMAHLTEVGLWQDTKGKKPEDLVQSIFGSILSGELTVKVLESTAKGVGNYFHRTWIDAQEKKNNFTPVFVPWYMIDIYSTRIERVDYYPFVSSMDEYEQFLFDEGATLEAIKWYREKSREINDRWRMCSEFPSTHVEAFQSTGSRVFPMKYVSNLRNMCIEPSMYGEFVGNGIKGKESLENIRFTELDLTPDKENILWVWMLPDNTINMRDRYVVAVDIGGASDTSDYSVITVADRLPMLEGGVPEIVAEWHGHTEHDLLTWKAAQIAKAYGNALLVIESNTLETDGTEGDNFEYILDIISQHYNNIYSRTTPEQIKQGMPTKYGFHTNSKTKPMVINTLKAAARDGLYLERCLPTTFELDMFELKSDGKKMGAIEGCHDDRVMARAILVYVCLNYDPPRTVTQSHNSRRAITGEASI